MTDETGAPVPTDPSEASAAEPVTPPVAGAAEPEPAPAQSAEVSAAWREVVSRMSDLGEAVSAWAKAAADNPENRRHLEEVRSGVNDMASKAGAAFSDVAQSDFGQQVSQGAQQAGEAIGDTAQKLSDAAAPHVASAFAGLADVFGRAAQRVDDAVKRQEAGGQSAQPAPEATTEAAADAPENAPTQPQPAPPADDPQ